MSKCQNDPRIDRCLVVATVAGLSLAVLTQQGLALSGPYLIKVAAGLAVLVSLVSWSCLYRASGHLRHHHHQRCDNAFAKNWTGIGAGLGAANQVTLARAVLLVLLLGMLGEHVDEPLMWGAVLVATAAGVTDAIDGAIARRTGTASAFGARFDMETDAALVAVLALLAWYWQRAGMWVLMAGAARYLFVLGCWCCGWMYRELPPSLRRKTVAAVQMVALTLCLAPLLTPDMSALCAAIAVSALLASFITDTLWLAMHAQKE